MKKEDRRPITFRILPLADEDEKEDETTEALFECPSAGRSESLQTLTLTLTLSLTCA
jgi:hypothetical protein